MKRTFTLLFTALTGLVCAQNVANFEDLNVPTNSYLDGSDQNGGFTSGDVFFPNSYDSQWESWSGWAISSTTDNTTPGFTNQYSAVPGKGANGSDTYAVSYHFASNTAVLANSGVVPGLYITNSTYAYYAMLDGDAFSKKFGGVTGNDPDFFVLTIKAYNNGSLSEDSVDFYLADFRSDDNSKDYILKDWKWVDLSSLGNADSLSFSLNSSDVGQWGMNTPAYFCVDNVLAQDPNSIQELVAENLISVFPNPAEDFITVNNRSLEELNIEIINANGAVLHSETTSVSNTRIDISTFAPGVYFVKALGNNSFDTHRILKK